MILNTSLPLTNWQTYFRRSRPSPQLALPLRKVVEDRPVLERAVYERAVVDSGAEKGTVVEGTGVARTRLASFGKRWLAVFRRRDRGGYPDIDAYRRNWHLGESGNGSDCPGRSARFRSHVSIPK